MKICCIAFAEYIHVLYVCAHARAREYAHRVCDMHRAGNGCVASCVRCVYLGDDKLNVTMAIERTREQRARAVQDNLFYEQRRRVGRVART